MHVFSTHVNNLTLAHEETLLRIPQLNPNHARKARLELGFKYFKYLINLHILCIR